MEIFEIYDGSVPSNNSIKEYLGKKMNINMTKKTLQYYENHIEAPVVGKVPENNDGELLGSKIPQINPAVWKE